MYTHLLLALILLLSSVSARVLGSQTVAALLPRQSSAGTVPAACTQICDPVNAEVNAGCTPATCCTISFDNAYFDCLMCIGTSLGTTDWSEPQQTLNNLIQECAEADTPIPQIDLPGQGTATPPGSTSTPSASGPSVVTNAPSSGAGTSTAIAPPVSKNTILPSPSVSLSASGSGSSSGSAASTSASTNTTPSGPSTPSQSSDARRLAIGSTSAYILAAGTCIRLLLF